MTHKSHNILTIWLLTVVILMTPWLSFWATPVLADENGERVVLCTLKGSQTVIVDSAGNIIEQHSEHCSALQLVKALGQTPPPGHPDSVTKTPNIPQRSIEPDYSYTAPLSVAYFGRAPPIN